MDLQYERQSPELIVDRYQDPFILGFSTYIWNINLSLEVARLAKKRFPNVVIVFGGPSAPAGEIEAEAFLRKNDFVDILVSGEGETAFLDLCHAKINGLDLKDVLSLALLDKNDFFQILDFFFQFCYKTKYFWVLEHFFLKFRESTLHSKLTLGKSTRS